MPAPRKYDVRDPVWVVLDPAGTCDDAAAWVVERHPNGSYHVVWANNGGGFGAAREVNMSHRYDAGPVPRFIEDAIEEAAEREAGP